MDFRESLGAGCYSIEKIGCIPEPIQSEVMGIEADLMSDLDVISIEDGLNLVNLLCEDKKDALDRLYTIGYALTSFCSKVRIQMQDQKSESVMNCVTYVITPQHGYFQVGNEFSKKRIHKFFTDCDQAISDIKEMITKGELVNVWQLAEVPREHFEGDAPWCPVCCLRESVSPDSTSERQEWVEWFRKIPLGENGVGKTEGQEHSKYFQELAASIEQSCPRGVEFLYDALACLSHGLYQPAIVETWKGFTEYMFTLMGTLPFDILRSRNPSWAKFDNLDELRNKAKDEQCLDALRAFKLINNEEVIAFKALKAKRNAAAHPSEHKQDLTEAQGFMDEVIRRICTINARLGKPETT